jgi:hypothetical protein
VSNCGGPRRSRRCSGIAGAASQPCSILDAWITQEILCEVHPDDHRMRWLCGGSAIMWAMVFEQVNPSGRVLTIDVEDRLDGARSVPMFAERVDSLLGSTVEPAILAEVSARAAGTRTLVILDSDHPKEHVAAELDTYAPLATLELPHRARRRRERSSGRTGIRARAIRGSDRVPRARQPLRDRREPGANVVHVQPEWVPSTLFSTREYNSLMPERERKDEPIVNQKRVLDATIARFYQPIAPPVTARRTIG